MNESLKISVGKKVAVAVRFVFEGKKYLDQIQGVLKEVDGNEITIVQHIPFCNLILGGETKTVERKINISDIEGSISFI
ncbi:hypothetical protein M8845_18980 [Gelidibacter japonicus]|uniref:hypothetical protein n=1 Tax=Gelidibacter japonicus TaxID=1962232 RepID=UPI002022841B|nr:hypothetical protein [Gelidibacter japonicus]MCL8009513.1 hypothetical protein [Gelidibacter japonicus]